MYLPAQSARGKRGGRPKLRSKPFCRLTYSTKKISSLPLTQADPRAMKAVRPESFGEEVN